MKNYILQCKCIQNYIIKYKYTTFSLTEFVTTYINTIGTYNCQQLNVHVHISKIALINFTSDLTNEGIPV